MKVSNLGFSLEERFAIAHAIDTVITDGDTPLTKEIEVLSLLMGRFDFDTNLILQARTMSMEQGLSILQEMPHTKKKTLLRILREIDIHNRFMPKKKATLIDRLYSHIGIEQKTKAAR